MQALASPRMLGFGLLFVITLALPNILILGVYQNVSYGLNIGNWLNSLGQDATFRTALIGVIVLASSLFWTYALQAYAQSAMIYGTAHRSAPAKLWSRAGWASLWSVIGLDFASLLLYLLAALTGAAGLGLLLYWHPSVSYASIIASAMVVALALFVLAAWVMLRILALGAVAIGQQSIGAALRQSWRLLRRYPQTVLGQGLAIGAGNVVGLALLGWAAIALYAWGASSALAGAALYLALSLTLGLGLLVLVVANLATWSHLYLQLAGRAGISAQSPTLKQHRVHPVLVLVIIWLALAAILAGLAWFEQPLILQWLTS